MMFQIEEKGMFTEPSKRFSAKAKISSARQRINKNIERLLIQQTVVRSHVVGQEGGVENMDKVG